MLRCTMVDPWLTQQARLQQDGLVDFALGFELLSLLVAADAAGGGEGGDVVGSHVLELAMGRMDWSIQNPNGIQ